MANTDKPLSQGIIRRMIPVAGLTARAAGGRSTGSKVGSLPDAAVEGSACPSARDRGH
jgi:hypothetical protein